AVPLTFPDRPVIHTQGAGRRHFGTCRRPDIPEQRLAAHALAFAPREPYSRSATENQADLFQVFPQAVGPARLGDNKVW
ncbi:MAG TPA: hypothetical protein VGM37_17340, partial [Armatimonadota bacterium]